MKRLHRMEEDFKSEDMVTIGPHGEGLSICEGNIVKGGQGYSTVLASKGIQEGYFYFEVELISFGEEQYAEPGNVRIGITNDGLQNVLATPVGKHEGSHGMRLSDGQFFTNAMGTKGNLSFHPGDVIGFVILLNPVHPPINGQIRTIDEESFMGVFLNGINQGIIKKGLYIHKYFAAASLFNGAKIRMYFSSCKHDYGELVQQHQEYPQIEGPKSYQSVANDQVEFDMSYHMS